MMIRMSSVLNVWGKDTLYQPSHQSAPLQACICQRSRACLHVLDITFLGVWCRFRWRARDASSPSFFPDLHNELQMSWNKPYSSCVFVPSTSIYLTIIGAKAQGDRMISQVEEMLMGYLSPDSALSLKKPVFPSRPCRTSSMVGRAFQVAGVPGWPA